MNWPSLPPDELIQSCARTGSTEAWEEFMRRFQPILTAAAIRVSRRWGSGSSDEIDDLIQEMYLKMCADGARILTSFRDSRPEAIFGYLKVTATNIAHDYFRRRTAIKRGSFQTVSLANLTEDPGSRSAIERQLTLTEIDDALLAETQKESGARDRMVFRLYYRQGMTAKAIAGLPGIGLTAKGVESVVLRLTRAIRIAMGETQEMGAE